MLNKKIIFIICFLSLISCEVKERPQFKYRNEISHQKNAIKVYYTKRFRDVVFYKCLHYGYGDKLNMEIGKLMAQKDLFSISDDQFLKENFVQDSLAKKVITNLPLPYVHVEDEKEIIGKNFIISTCLSYYESKELDLISKNGKR